MIFPPLPAARCKMQITSVNAGNWKVLPRPRSWRSRSPMNDFVDPPCRLPRDRTRAAADPTRKKKLYLQRTDPLVLLSGSYPRMPLMRLTSSLRSSSARPLSLAFARLCDWKLILPRVYHANARATIIVSSFHFGLSLSLFLSLSLSLSLSRARARCITEEIKVSRIQCAM